MHITKVQDLKRAVNLNQSYDYDRPGFNRLYLVKIFSDPEIEYCSLETFLFEIRNILITFMLTYTYEELV